jgi:RNA polymerase sigma-70 factor (ECF subfamily)
MSNTVRSASGNGATYEVSRQDNPSEVCNVTGERLLWAGEYVAPGKYVEIETLSRVILTHPDFLPRRLDGQVTCYRPAARRWGHSTERTLAQRQEQFQILTARMHPRLFHFVLRRLGNSPDAEDVTQEALVRAWAHFEDFDPRRAFEAWVFRIARNLVFDQMRRRRYRQEVSLDSPSASLDGTDGRCRPELYDSANDPEECLMAREISTELQIALRSLSPAYRAPLLLIAEQRSYEQIARDLDCPIGTVRSRLFRARVMLRRSLKESALNIVER